MNDEEITALRLIVRNSKENGNRVVWLDDGGKFHSVRDVPERELDPDDTGFTDFVAFLDKGHIDLSNADPASFFCLTPAFPE